MYNQCQIIRQAIFDQSGHMDDSYYNKLSTEKISVIFRVPYLTMAIIEHDDFLIFNIKMTIKDNRDFFNTLKLNGFCFKPEIEQNIRNKFDPIHRQKDLLQESLNIHVNYVIEHMFYFTKTNEIYKHSSTCCHDIDGCYLFINVETDENDQIAYTYIGYHDQIIIKCNYKIIPDYEFCISYLKQQFQSKGEVSILSEINASNFLNYYKLLKMLNI